MNVRYSLILFCAITFIGCGGDPVKKGNEALQKNKPEEALAFYQDALKKNPNDDAVKTKMALAYFANGDKMLAEGGSLKGAEAQIKFAQKYYGENPPAEIKKAHASLLGHLGDIEGKKKAEDAIPRYDAALAIDPENAEIKAKNDAIKKANFQVMLDKGKAALDKGKKDDYQNFVAEYYLAKANSYDAINADAAKYLSQARRKTQTMLNEIDDAIPIAVPQIQKVGTDIVAFFVIIKNQARKPLDLSLKNFAYYDKSGKKFAYDESIYPQFKNKFPEKTIGDMEEAQGVVAFTVGKVKEYGKLVYDDGQGNVIEKYFP
jgi:tetratricopeptide (TPR) repeat protein